jgi:peptidoglycan/xylan/chitin deacetylase (PgdA/CDA1 family)
MSKLRSGWYVLLYHDVSWEEGPFVRHIGGTCAPDVFRDHVRACRGAGQIVSVDDGMSRLEHNTIDGPLFSFWFDDGLAGVRKYAAPVLEEYGVTGAVSICSRFLKRQEMFWRFKLSYLQSVDAGRFLRSRLRTYGYSTALSLRNFTIENFSPDILSAISDLYDEAVSHRMQQDAFRLFDTPEGVRDLHRRGWTVANHTAAHHPLGQARAVDTIIEQFEECERVLGELTAAPTRYWVFPFGQERGLEQAVRQIRECGTGRVPVLVRNKVNSGSDYAAEPALFRIDAPVTSRSRLPDVLSAAGRSS